MKITTPDIVTCLQSLQLANNYHIRQGSKVGRKAGQGSLPFLSSTFPSLSSFRLLFPVLSFPPFSFPIFRLSNPPPTRSAVRNRVRGGRRPQKHFWWDQETSWWQWHWFFLRTCRLMLKNRHSTDKSRSSVSSRWTKIRSCGLQHQVGQSF